MVLEDGKFLSTNQVRGLHDMVQRYLRGEDEDEALRIESHTSLYSDSKRKLAPAPKPFQPAGAGPIFCDMLLKRQKIAIG